MLKLFAGSARRYLFNLVNSPAIVLLYHRVTEPGQDPQQLAVNPANFFDHVELLKKQYRILQIDEFTELLQRRKKFPKNSVVLTFDDGYADNYHEALPILESHSAEALFYIATAHLDTDLEFWWDELERIFLTEQALPVQPGTSHPAEAKKKYADLHQQLKYQRPCERDNEIAELKEIAGVPLNGRPSHRMMRIEELKKMMSSSSARIGAHTHRHPALSSLRYEEQFNEINTSKQILEKLLKRKIEHFSYPYGGRGDYNDHSINICKEIGFKMVSANRYGQVHSWTNAYEVPRILVRNWNKAEFKKKLRSFLSTDADFVSKYGRHSWGRCHRFATIS